MTTLNPDIDTKLLQEIRILNRRLHKLNSFRYIFLRGVVTGFATFVGATLVVGIVFYYLSNFLANFDNLKIISEVLNNIVNTNLPTGQ